MTKKGLGLAGLALTAALASGCASWPVPVKIVATPIAAARDVVDLPLSTIAYGASELAEASKGSFGNMGFVSDGRSGGCSIDVTYPVAGIISLGLGIPDYLACRSFVGDAKGVSPWKWRPFPNIRELWCKEPEEPPARSYNRYR